MQRRRKSENDNKLTKLLREMLPNVTLADFNAIREIAGRGHLRHLSVSITAWQAITTHIRHNHTDYDLLLADGYDAESARHFVRETMNDKLAEWGCDRTVPDDPEQSDQWDGQ